MCGRRRIIIIVKKKGRITIHHPTRVKMAAVAMEMAKMPKI
jgi:hypothetical protein